MPEYCGIREDDMVWVSGIGLVRKPGLKEAGTDMESIDWFKPWIEAIYSLQEGMNKLTERLDKLEQAPVGLTEHQHPWYFEFLNRCDRLEKRIHSLEDRNTAAGFECTGISNSEYWFSAGHSLTKRPEGEFSFCGKCGLYVSAFMKAFESTSIAVRCYG